MLTNICLYFKRCVYLPLYFERLCSCNISHLMCCCIVLYCGRVPAANVSGCTAAEGLLYKPWSSVVPTCTARCLHQRPLALKGGTTWPRNGRWILPENARLPLTFRDLLHAVNLRHGTNGFTSLPKEGLLRIFSPWKVRRLRPGLNPPTWVPKASTLPLDHRSRYVLLLVIPVCRNRLWNWLIFHRP